MFGGTHENHRAKLYKILAAFTRILQRTPPSGPQSGERRSVKNMKLLRSGPGPA